MIAISMTRSVPIGGFQIEEDQRAIKWNRKRQWLSHTKDNNEARTE
jgi:hypothetical protein